MGWLKRAVVGLLALCSLDAKAAELPALPEAPALPPAQSLGNWYVRGDLGATSYSTGRWTQAVTGLAQGDQLVSAGFVSRSVRDSGFVGAGLGYEIHPWVRVDITTDYRSSAALRGNFQESAFNPSTPLAFLGKTEFAGSLQTAVVMANAYADLGTWYGFTPYVGAGIGLAHHELSGFTGNGVAISGTDFTSINANSTPVPVAFLPGVAKTRTDPAWSLMAGISYSISPNLKLDLGYRHLDLGDIRSGPINCLCRESFAGVKVRNIASNEIRLGVRWVFGEAGPMLGTTDDLPEIPR
ncbi:MAG: porin family protein [Hyphomicrobiales bacterium]|nr:porin family protein [Hyphomicrobiales bacterium]